MSLSGVFDSPIDDKKKISLTKVFKILSYGIALIVIVILPTLESNKYILSFKEKIPDSVFLLSALGFSFITMYLGDIYKEKFRLLLKQAKLEGKQDLLAQIKNVLENKKIRGNLK